MKAWKLLLGAGLLTAAASQANATVSLYLQESGVNGGNATYIGGSNSGSYAYSNTYGDFAVGVNAAGLGTGPNFFTQTLDVSSGAAATLTVYLVNSGLTTLSQSLLSTFTANGYNLVSVNESTYLNGFDAGSQIGSASFDVSNLGATFSNSAAVSATGSYFEVAKYVIQTKAGGAAANSTINITAAGAVPEPASWAMMLAGFGVAGFAMRRNRRTTTSVRFA